MAKRPFEGLDIAVLSGRDVETKDPEVIKQRIERAHSVRNWGPRDGICFSCKRQIFKILNGTKDITGCPYCHRTYCD